MPKIPAVNNLRPLNILHEYSSSTNEVFRIVSVQGHSHIPLKLWDAPKIHSDVPLYKIPLHSHTMVPLLFLRINHLEQPVPADSSEEFFVLIDREPDELGFTNDVIFGNVTPEA